MWVDGRRQWRRVQRDSQWVRRTGKCEECFGGGVSRFSVDIVNFFFFF